MFPRSFPREGGLACSSAVATCRSRVPRTHEHRVHVLARAHAHMWGYTCAQHTRIDADGEVLPRYRSSSWPPRVMPYPLALHNNLLRRVCSGIFARTLPPVLLFLFSPPAYPFVSWSVLRPCISSFFYPHLFALRELDAVGVPSSPPFLPSAICLPTQYTEYVLYVPLRPIGSFMRMIFYWKNACVQWKKLWF